MPCMDTGCVIVWISLQGNEVCDYVTYSHSMTRTIFHGMPYIYTPFPWGPLEVCAYHSHDGQP